MSSEQTNSSLKLIQPKNVMFGSLGLTKSDDKADLKNISPTTPQMPSLYIGDKSASPTLRYRPFHNSGFVALTKEDRTYFIYCENPDVSKRKIAEGTYKDDQSFVDYLGNSATEITPILRDLSTQSVTKQQVSGFNNGINTDAFSELKEIVQVVSDDIAGTFWALVETDSGKLYCPIRVVDTKTSNVQDDKLPKESGKIHWGHYLLPSDFLANYYERNTVTLGSELLLHLFGLGNFAQNMPVTCDGLRAEVVPGKKFLSRSSCNNDIETQFDAIKQAILEFDIE
ncbi:hypothetical protein PsAD2_02301 [Pseudovibrio axinellae]|uniref:Uncharacterized protein n=1 Tax=Pseudovibrio axinellae TaxID=989403 RepID=A0A165YEZ0_9HYPH|nr:hypothetical protein [Pseudovibrio axinellae]KZL18785.1 hypothetical protein PsAD2_02301 [Pseudovibrio axinellae]SEP92889.1 hypothetical protein SAMN05421798_101740 [Pseudovibrio axinellae]